MPMLFTREYDYAVRILRALSSGTVVNVQEIARLENISVPITYKITRKLEQAGYLESFRGVNGGYAIKTPLSAFTLYDVLLVIDRELLVTECMNPAYVCTKNSGDTRCLVHGEFARIQDLVSRELKSKTLAEVFAPANRK